MRKILKLLVLLSVLVNLYGCSSKISTHLGPPVSGKIEEGTPSFAFDVTRAFNESMRKKDYRFMGMKYPEQSVPGLSQSQEKALLASRNFRYIEAERTYISGTSKKGDFTDHMAFSIAAETYNGKMLAFLKSRK